MQPEQPESILALVRPLFEPDVALQATALMGGRTNSVWKIDAVPRTLVLKLYSQNTGAGTILFPNDANAEISCLAALEGTGLAPELVAADTSQNAGWICYKHITGSMWDNKTSLVASSLRVLHDQPGFAGLREIGQGPEALTEQAVFLLEDCASEQAHAMLSSVPEPPAVDAIDPVFLHGDPVPGNILVTKTGIRFIDWQCPAWGDPTDDIAIFLSPAMQYLYRGRTLTQTDEAEFLSAYDRPTLAMRYMRLKPLYHWRMAAYCLWKAERGHSEYRAAFDFEMRALHMLENRVS